MQIMSDSHFQYRSYQNQLENYYDGRKTLSVEILLVVLSLNLARENTDFVLCYNVDRESRDRILHEPPVCTSYFPCFSKYQHTI